MRKNSAHKNAKHGQRFWMHNPIAAQGK